MHSESNFYVDVGEGHRIRVVTLDVGSDTTCCVFHGGPGSGIDVDRAGLLVEGLNYVFIEQRGCGISSAEHMLEGNTTRNLLLDTERVLSTLSFKHLILYGHSWGGTLAVLYAATIRPPDGMVLSGPWIGGHEGISWYHDEANIFCPVEVEAIIHLLNLHGMSYSIESIRDSIMSSDENLSAAILPLLWRREASLTYSALESIRTIPALVELRKEYQIQYHYLANRLFLGGNGVMQFTKGMSRFPLAIIQGGSDLVCPPIQAVRLHKELGFGAFDLIQGVGHTKYQPKYLAAITSRLIELRHKYE